MPRIARMTAGDMQPQRTQETTFFAAGPILAAGACSEGPNPHHGRNAPRPSSFT